MSFRRRLAVVAAALAAAATAFVLLLHAPIVRRAALRYVLPLVERQYGLRLEAARLDYNVPALRIGLADVRLSAPATPDDPFFVADYVSVTLARRAVVGPLAFRDISVTNARVTVRVREDGTTNLPSASDGPTGEPPPLRVGQLGISRLSIDLRDEQAATFLWMPSIALLLTPEDGYIRASGEAQLYTEKQLTYITRLSGDASFDGRALHVANLQLQTDELSAQLDGSLALIAEEQAIDVRARGTADATGLARWAVTNGHLPRGDLAFEGETTGVLDDLTTRLSVTSERLDWQQVTATDLAVRMHVTAGATDVEELRFGFAGGRVTADARLPFDGHASGRVSASWTDVNAASAALALAPGASVVPSGSLSGRLDAQGTGVDPARWSASLHANSTPGRNARGRIALAGAIDVRLADNTWQLDARPIVGAVAPMMIALRSGPSGDAEGPFLRTPVAGTIQLSSTDLPALVAMLRTTGIAAAATEDEAIAHGTIEAGVRVTGTLAEPAIDGRASIRNIEAAQVQVMSLEVALSGRPLQPYLEFRANAPDVVVAGQLLSQLDVAGRATDTLVEVDTLSARQPSGPGLLTAGGAYSLDTARYTLSVDGQQWRLTPTGDQPVAADVSVRFAGEGTVDAPRGTGTVEVRNAIWRDVMVGDVDASITLDGRTADIDASAPTFAASAHARVHLDVPYAATIDARAQGLDLARLLQPGESRRIGSTPPEAGDAQGVSNDAEPTLPGPITGTTSFEVHAEGPLQTWRSGSAVLEVTSVEAAAGELPVRLTEPARLRYEGERVYVDRLEAAAGETRLSASGDLPVFTAAPDVPGIIVTVTGDVAEVARAAAATGLTELPVTGGEGPVALLARVTGVLQSPIVAADLEIGPGSVALEELPPVSGLRVRAHAESGWLELREGAASFENAELSVTGKAPLALLTSRGAGPVGPAGGADPSAPGTGEAVIHVRATNLTPAVLAPFLDPGTVEQLAGSVDATLDVSTPTFDVADVTGELRIDRFDIRIADLPVTQRVPTRIVARDGFARVEAWDWVGQGATLGVRGQVRLEDRQTGILANGVVDLRLLTPFIREAGLTTAGRLEPRLSITGALDSPRVDGDLVVTDGEIRLVDPRVLVSDLSIRTVLTRTSARITSMTGAVNGGSLTGGGVVEYSPDAGIEAQLATDIRGIALEFPQGLRSEIDAALNLSVAGTGPPVRPYTGQLSGTVTVVRSTYREPMAVVTGLLAGLRTQRLAAAGESSPLLESLALDVRLVTDEDLIVDNNYARVQLGGDLRLIGTAAAPALSGRAELREGGQLFVGRNVYTVNFGAIDFANPVAIEPELNVEAVTRAGGEDIEVAIVGPAESPTVTLSSPSDPDLGQAELASLLLTGRRLEDLAPGDAAFVGTQVLGNFSAEVLGFASRAVGLDTLRLGGVENQVLRRDPAAIATELDPTTRLTFGKSLGPDLDVTFSQSLRDSDAQTWIVNYVPARGFELRLVSDDDDLRSYGFRQDMSLGGAARPDQTRPGPQQVEEPRVAAVMVSGDLGLPEARVRAALELGEGHRFDFARWQSDRDRVESLYRTTGYLTARITARRSDQPGGVALTYDIVAGPQTRIEVTGLDLDSGLRSQLETAWFQSVFDDFLTDEAAQVVRRHLARRGYLQPSVAVRIRDEGSAKTLVIIVEPGARSTRTTVRVDSASDALAAEIVAHLTERNLVEGAVLDPGTVEDATEEYLRASGYLRARVMAGAPLFEEATAILPLTVESGPVFTIASVAFEGTQTLADQELRDVAAVAEGEPYDPAAVEATRERLVALHRREGFASVSVIARPDVRADAAAVDVVFVVEEGARQVLDEVVVSGNRAIDADVIVRALGVKTGAPLRSDDVLRARLRVFETGLFRRIDVASEPIESADAPGASPVAPPATTPMRLRVTVEEWPAARLRYGFVVAEERPETNPEGRELVPGLSADLTRRTIFGRAISVGAAVQAQRRDRSTRAFLLAPTLFGLGIESSVSVHSVRQEFSGTTRVDSRRGISFEQRVRPSPELQISYAYRFEHSRTELPPDELIGTLPPVAVDIARLSGSAAWDTRDDPSDTSRGSLFSSNFEFASETVGSDIRFVRQLGQAYYFRGWHSVVFASAARVGLAVPLGGQDLSLSERFFAGGSRTIRGVAESALGPRDFFGDPAGGRLMLVLNQEARVPIYRWVRGVAFIDAGNVFARPRDASLRDLVGSAGVGLRLATPFALLRVDFAKPVWGNPETTSGRWTFGIGHAF